MLATVLPATSNFHNRTDKISVAHAMLQSIRLMLRDQSTAAEAQMRIDSQMPLTAKVQAAGFVLENDGSIEDLQKQVGTSACDAIKLAGHCSQAVLRPEAVESLSGPLHACCDIC